MLSRNLGIVNSHRGLRIFVLANVSLSLEVINTAGCLDAQADAMRPPPVDVKPHMLDAKTCGSVPSSISAALATSRWEP